MRLRPDVRRVAEPMDWAGHGDGLQRPVKRRCECDQDLDRRWPARRGEASADTGGIGLQHQALPNGPGVRRMDTKPARPITLIELRGRRIRSRQICGKPHSQRNR